MVSRQTSFALETGTRKTVFLLTWLVGLGFYLSLCGRHFIASYYAGRPNRENLLRAAWLEPQNSEYQYLLGRYSQWIAREPDTALRYYRAAIALNPHKASYWFDLSTVYQLTGNHAQESIALQQAILTDPTSPEIAWEAANLAWAQGDRAKALREFRTAMDGDASLAPAALERCWRINPDVDAILKEAVPPKTDVYSSFLSFLITKNDAVGTGKLWRRLMELQQPVEQRYVFEYVRYLVDRHAVEEANRAWQDAGRLSDLSAYQTTPDNLVINSDLSLPLLNAGFDWSYERVAGVSMTLDAVEARSGHPALAIAFDSPGVEDAGMRQMIPVEPGSRYEFSAYFKTEDLQGAGGARLSLEDYYTRASLFSTDDLKDAAFWKPTSGRFTTGPETTLLLLRLQHVPPQTAIRGKLWIDGIRLTKDDAVARVQ